MRILAVSLLLLAPLAGCIEAPQPDEETPASTREPLPAAVAPPVDRIEGMSAEETKEDTVGRCEDGGLGVPPGAFCAQRVLTVVGRVGLDELPVVDLRSVNGAIRVTEGPGDAWSFHAVVKTRALTEEDARRSLDEGWAWSHEEDGVHHLKAGPRAGIPLVGATVTHSEYAVVLPGWLRLGEASLRTTNGEIVLGSFAAESLDAKTTNGDITTMARLHDAHLQTTNGDLHAVLVPTQSGEWTLRTTNGDVDLVASEHLTRGYEIEAETSNGDVEIRLTQGKVKEESRDRKTFRTDGFESRDVQTRVRATSTNGDVTVVG